MHSDRVTSSEQAATRSNGNNLTLAVSGLAAAQRFSSTIKPRGHRRHRERPGPGKIISTSAKLLPCRVYTAQVRSTWERARFVGDHENMRWSIQKVYTK